jgi:GDPmannose 4,6-dehydratase
MKKALIFGVSGQDGAYLAKLLLSKGYTVYGTSRDAQVSSFRNLEYLGIRQQVQLESAALNDFRSVLQVLKKTQPDEVYNLAGQTSVEVFGDINGAAADESTPFSPRSPYAVAKATAFWEVANYREAYGLFACSGILFNHDSPLRPERFVTQKIVASAVRIAAGTQDKLYLGNVDIQRDWGWAEDYVVAMYLMLQQEESDDYVIATGESYKYGFVY